MDDDKAAEEIEKVTIEKVSDRESDGYTDENEIETNTNDNDDDDDDDDDDADKTINKRKTKKKFIKKSKASHQQPKKEKIVE